MDERRAAIAAAREASAVADQASDAATAAMLRAEQHAATLPNWKLSLASTLN